MIRQSPFKTDVNELDQPWLTKQLSKIPEHMRGKIRRVHRSKLDKYGRQLSNRYLREVTASICERLAPCDFKPPLTWSQTSRKDYTEEQAAVIARHCRESIAVYGEIEMNYADKLKVVYEAIADKISVHYIEPPSSTTKFKTTAIYEIALLKLSCDGWWKRRLLTARKRCLEALQIALGNVKKKKGAYVSDSCLADWQADQKRQIEFLERYELESENGDVISLIDAYNSGVANTRHRRTELMIRSKGIEELATEQGKAGFLFTLTTPSKYHRTRNRGHHLNPKWQGFTPKDGQEYLCKVWARVRAAWKRQYIQPMGFRVVEPHADATPHWHLFLFIEPEKKAEAIEIFKKYAIAEDFEEIERDTGPRFDVLEIDPSKGSATGYIAKYIAKNIAADDLQFGSEIDFETGDFIAETVQRVRAWASCWGIRQFQQIGGASVSVYRELRRIDEVEDSALEQVRSAADHGKFAEFIKLMNEKNVKLEYEIEISQYNEEVKKIVGVNLDQKPTLTRLVKWVRQIKGTSAANADALAFQEHGMFSWTRGNNCTQLNSHEENRQSKLSIAVENAGFDNDAIDLMLSGFVVANDCNRLKIRNGRLIQQPIIRQ